MKCIFAQSFISALFWKFQHVSLCWIFKNRVTYIQDFEILWQLVGDFLELLALAFYMLCVGSFNSYKRFLVCCVSCGCQSENIPLASQVDTSKWLLVDCMPLVTRCCTWNRLCQALPYQVLITFWGSCYQYSLDLSSNYFTWEKFASKCDVASEWYHAYLAISNFIYWINCAM